MSSYSTSAKLLMYIGSPSDVSQLLILPRFPSGSLVKSNSDVLQGTCGENGDRDQITFQGQGYSHRILLV